MKSCLPCLALVVLSACRPSAQPLAIPDLPDPPQQRAAWAPPATGISSNLVSAANTLSDQGFPDPRGCEYREVQVEVSGVWGRERLLAQTHGWVLPASAADTNRFAICWNGLIYPVAKLGEAASLPADATNLIPPNARRFNLGLGEIRSVFWSNSPPSARVLLLLRCGETEAALKNWVPNEQVLSQTISRTGKAPDEAAQSYDPYLEIAGDWAWALFDHTLCAHMRSDVPLALVTARKLTEVQPKVEAEAAKRGFRHPSYSDSAKHDTERPYLYFLDQLPRLVADLERRARGPKQKSVLEIGVTNITSQSKRIAALIEDLDLVQARQWGQPGMVNPAEDPIVGALIQEGDAAVGPLIDCLESDKRLTRSVGFSRDFHRDRVVIPVSSAARAALQMILRVQFRTPAEFRAYWKQNEGTKLEERWYSTLKNDRAGNGQWLQAARSIMQPENVSGVPGGYSYTEKPLNPGEKPRLRGEILRTKKNPSVTELLLKRANSAAEEANKLDQSMAVDAMRTGCEFVRILSEWSRPSVAVAPARSLMRHSIGLWPNWTTFIGSSGHDLARYIPQLTEIRVMGGDTNALAEYAEWVKSAGEEKMDQYALDAFEPLVKNPTNPTAVAVSDWLFNNPASPWNKLPWKRVSFHNPIESELIKVTAFRRLLVRELEKRDVAGSMEYFRANTVSYNLKEFGGGTRGFPWPESEPPTIGTKVEVRQCDWIAWSLSNAKRIPFFNPFAPVEKRDQAIANAQAVLEKWE